jgi:hypothetical protein
LQTLDALACPVPPATGTGSSAQQEYYRALQTNFRRLFDLVFEYLIDCICHHLLPACAVEPCDDRLILACLEVRGGRIVRIGNFCCRRMAGSFPAIGHWLSLIPGFTLMIDLIKALCCDPDISDFLFDQVRTRDPNGVAVGNFSANDFAVPKAYAGTLSHRATATFKRVFDFDRLTRPGDDTSGNLGGVIAQPVEQPPAELRAELDELRQEMSLLKAEIERLNGGQKRRK